MDLDMQGGLRRLVERLVLVTLWGLVPIVIATIAVALHHLLLGLLAPLAVFPDADGVSGTSRSACRDPARRGRCPGLGGFGDQPSGEALRCRCRCAGRVSSPRECRIGEGTPRRSRGHPCRAGNSPGACRSRRDIGGRLGQQPQLHCRPSGKRGAGARRHVEGRRRRHQTGCHRFRTRHHGMSRQSSPPRRK